MSAMNFKKKRMSTPVLAVLTTVSSVGKKRQVGRRELITCNVMKYESVDMRTLREEGTIPFCFECWWVPLKTP